MNVESRMAIRIVVLFLLFASGYLVGVHLLAKSVLVAPSCVRVTADVSKADIDAYIHSLDGRGEWSVLVEPDGDYTVISRPRSCEK